jgi:hypothetical protein
VSAHNAPTGNGETERQSAEYVRRYWRCGEQVGRTLYVDHGDGEKNPALLFGMVDTPELAAHIVEVHNWWVTVRQEADEKWKEWLDEELPLSAEAEQSDGSS